MAWYRNPALTRLRLTLAVSLLGLAGCAPAHAATTGVEIRYFGVVRSTPTWHILADAAHQPSNLTGVVCNPADGRLTVELTPMTQVGAVLVGADETWAGKFHAGASVGLSRAVIVIRNSAGTVVSCASPLLSAPNGNFWITGYGWA